MSQDDAPEPHDAGTPQDPLRRERDDLYDRLLRMTAEFDNYRKRIDRERRDVSEAAAADLIRDLLPVLDDLERALAAPGWAADDANRRGIELIHRHFFEALRKRGVTPIDAVGQDFNPEIHEGVGHDPLDGHRDGEVTADVRRGYRIGGKLLRPTMVKVAKA